MAEPSRLAALPGYDTAPDVYETPELTDDTSTTMQTAATSPPLYSDASETSDEENEDDEHGEGFGVVSRRRLYPSRARGRFGAASGRVEAKRVDLSDRVDGRRRGYQVRAARKTEGTQAQEEESEEGLETRIARLRREVEECRAEVARMQHEKRGAQEGMEGGEKVNMDDVDALTRLLAEIDAPPARPKERRGMATVGLQAESGRSEGLGGNVMDEQTLRKVADFDVRLSALEQAIGISSLDAATSEVAPTPILPSLTVLDQQLSALSSASSLANLEAASSRISKLRVEAEQLAHAGRGDGESADGESEPMSSEDMQKLQHLYTLLPSLQALSPTVPALLQRLRSLRALHTSAANAATELEEVEKRQAEMESELRVWRDGLQKVETAVREASEANGRNGRVVEKWVKDLEIRLKVLG
ncbi:hypothetical protein M433DRAFT_4662 [Acidomyces richmondensis BFW]|nr:MAG: hypothetical protein FE78DRAFT_377526 [Acidomyces sp. 'richmondensis']KYG45356.1 hypothetical protein M433DRAFT_4662 [Acidomyces richmondensis BFW]